MYSYLVVIMLILSKVFEIIPFNGKRILVIIWKKYGFLVPLLLVLFFMISFFLPISAEKINLRLGSIFTTYSIFLWLWGTKINRNAKRDVIDKLTSQVMKIDNSSSFFFIKVQYWAIPSLLIGIFFYYQYFSS